MAAFLLSLSQAEARMLSATAEVRWEGMGRDYREREREREQVMNCHQGTKLVSAELGCTGGSLIPTDSHTKREWRSQTWKMNTSWR